MQDTDPRFTGLGRLYPPGTLTRLKKAHVCVVGIGGVGSWVAEALARSGVGRITLVDLDEVCISNFNRQSLAVEGFLAKPKVEAMAARIHLIHPGCEVFPRQEFFTISTEQELLNPGFDAVVDAIDSVTNKVRLAAACLARSIPLVISGAAGGRVNATAVRMAPLYQASHDRLLGAVRKNLKLSLPPDEWEKAAQLPCVFSNERARSATEDSCKTGSGRGPRMNCEAGYGSAVFVTGSFGFAAAGWVVNRLAEG